jgi:PAS domain S-box-containing protein
VVVAGSPEDIVLPAVLDLRATLRLASKHDLPPDVESPAAARRYVRTALESAERTEWLDAAQLATTEIVTNAVLHAHSSVQLWIGVSDDELCVEVRDFNPTMPMRRDYDAEATTGRGMGLVASLTTSCGVQSLGASGKVVWFCLGDEESELDPDALLAAWDLDDRMPPVSGETHEVVLPSMPPTLWLSARQHHDAIIRELTLYMAQHEDLVLDVAAADAARVRISSAVVTEIDAAQAAGTAEPALPIDHPSPLPWVPKQLDLHLTVPVDCAADFAALQDLLDAAERLAVDSELLIRPALPEITAVRDWACEQVIAQLNGNEPAPWPGTDQERFEWDVHDRANPPLPEWDSRIVVDAVTGAIAADDANRIIAISRPLADALGWDPAELVGRRVVTVIPPALREAHVAGFSRHLNTGEAHVIGVPLDLPVLRRDGSEIECRFLIERAQVGAGRAVYVAWIDPLTHAG